MNTAAVGVRRARRPRRTVDDSDEVRAAQRAAVDALVARLGIEVVYPLVRELAEARGIVEG